MEILVRLAGVQLGPYSAKQVRDYVTEGLLSMTDQAKTVGTDNWISVAEMLTKTGEMPGAEPATNAPEAAVEPAGNAISTEKTEQRETSTPPIEPEPEEELQPEPEVATAEEPAEEPRRAPEAASGVTHLPTRQKERIPLPTNVDASSRKTILIGPTPPAVPSPSGRTKYPTLTTAPLTKTPPQGAKQSSRAAVKNLAQQTSPLPTKSIKAAAKEPPPETNAKQGVTPHPTQKDDQQPRQSLLRSLTAKTVPMRTSSAPPLPAGPSGTIPVTAPLPSRSTIKIQEPVRAPSPPPQPAPPARSSTPPPTPSSPPSVVDDLTKKLGQVVKPDAGPIRAPKEPASKEAPTRQLPPKDTEVETVKIDLKKIKPSDKAGDKAFDSAPAEPGDEKEKPPARKRSLRGLIYLAALVVALAIYYIWTPYHASTLLQNALNDGDVNGLDSTINFPSVQASLKAQVDALLVSGVQNNGATETAMADARDMMDKSIDLFVTKEGISGLVGKSGQFSPEQLAKTISFSTASKIFLGFNSATKKKGFGSISDFTVQKDTALLHLRLQGLNWKLKQIDLTPDLRTPSSPNAIPPFLSPVVDTYTERAEAAAKKNDWTWAINDYSAVLALAPHSSVAYNARASARQSKGDLDGAMKDYTEALRIDPQMSAAYEGRGNVKASKKDPDLDGAIADYTQAILFDKNMAAAYDGRGNAKTAKDDLEGAINDYTQAILIDPSYAAAYSDRGFARQANGNLDGAIDDYTIALKLKPKTAVAYYNRGLARQSQGNYGAAIVDYDRALAFDPKIAGAYYNRGNAKNATHDLDGAIADFTQAIALNPKIALAYCNRGVAWQAKGNLDSALADYTQALSIDPKIAIAYYNRGRIKQIKNDPDGAISDSSQALDLDPKNAQAYFARGFAKLSKGNLDGAQEDLKQFCDASPHDHDVDHARIYLWLIGKGLNATPDPDQALSDALENNWNASPDDFVSKTAGFLLGRVNETDYLASAASPDSTKDQGQHCEAWYYAGMKRLLMGDRTTAIDYFHKSIDTKQGGYCEYLLAQAQLKAFEPMPVPAPPAAPVPAGQAPPPAPAPAAP